MSNIKISDELRAEFRHNFYWFVIKILEYVNKKLKRPIVVNANVDEVINSIELLFGELEISDEAAQRAIFDGIRSLSYSREPEYMKASNQLKAAQQSSQNFHAAYEIVNGLIESDPGEWYSKSKDVLRFRDALKHIATDGLAHNMKEIFRHFSRGQAKSIYQEKIFDLVTTIKKEHRRENKKIKLEAINSALSICIDTIYLSGLRKSSSRAGIGAATRKGKKRKYL